MHGTTTLDPPGDGDCGFRCVAALLAAKLPDLGFRSARKVKLALGPDLAGILETVAGNSVAIANLLQGLVGSAMVKQLRRQSKAVIDACLSQRKPSTQGLTAADAHDADTLATPVR